jgi:hypothetical protein
MKHIYNIIFATMLCWTPAMSTTPLEAAGDEASTSLAIAETHIQNVMDDLEVQLGRDTDALVGYYRTFCKKDVSGALVLSQCGDDQATNENETKSVIIDYVTGGWYPINEIAPERSNLASSADLEVAFDLLDKEANGLNPNGIPTNAFDDKLCIEVHFKNTDEVEFALPLYSDKTLVFCATTLESGELVNLKHVGTNAPEPNSQHLQPGDWRCFNPHNGFLNGGQAFGYDDTDADPSTVPTRATAIIDGFLQGCIDQVTINIE